MRPWGEHLDWNTEPRPISGELGPRAEWPAISIFQDVATRSDIPDALIQVLQRRRTQRELSPTSITDVCGLIQTVFRTQDVRGMGAGTRARKALVSAGALHTIDVIVCGPDLPGPILFCDRREAFVELDVSARDRFDQAVERLTGLVPTARGHLVVYAANIAKLRSAYANPQTLLFRDAGAADQLLSMAASAAEMSYVPLGALADDLVQAILPSSAVIGAGCGIIGKPI